jgi:hypothetical protein
MKTYGGVEVQLHALVTSAMDGDERLASHPGRFTPRERVPRTHWTRGWVGRRASLDAVAKRKIPYTCLESNSGRPAPSLVSLLN